MARIVWAILQPHSKRKLDENTFRFDFSPRPADRPQTPEAYKAKALAVYARAGLTGNADPPA